MSFVFQAEVRSDLGKVRAAACVMLTWFLPSFTVQAKPCPVTLDHKKLILAQEKPEFYSSS